MKEINKWSHAISEDKILQILKKLEPKIKHHIRQTGINDQEDLEQELKILLIEKIDALFQSDAPGFFEYLEQLEQKERNLLKGK